VSPQFLSVQVVIRLEFHKSYKKVFLFSKNEKPDPETMRQVIQTIQN
jgi:hypothetical protein